MNRRHNEHKRKNKVKSLFLTQPVNYNWNWATDYSNIDDYYEDTIGGGFFRHIHTFHERRWNIITDDEWEVGVQIRGRRTAAMLPCEWDDVMISHHINGTSKNWKHNSKRKRQWKYE